MVDSVYRTRSLGIGARGIPDQYADGKAARVWEAYIGSICERTGSYRRWIVDMLRTHDCRRVLDAACGTGVDSVVLVEEGFDVVSTDASDKMLKYALKERWGRRRDPAFDRWIIEEGNWLTLVDDVRRFCGGGGGGDSRFDAVICLGNSFAHLPDFEGGQADQRRALGNFRDLLRPGGILVIDHRNYDHILESGSVPANNVYYNSPHVTGIKCSTLYVDRRPTMVTMDYSLGVDVSTAAGNEGKVHGKVQGGGGGCAGEEHRFRLSYYPHRLAEFTNLLHEVFGPSATHSVFGDFRALGEIETPAYYIHVVQRVDE